MSLIKNAINSERVKFNVYIYKLFKNIYPTLGISRAAMKNLNSFIIDLIERIMNECFHLCKKQMTKIIDVRTIGFAVSLCIGGDLAIYSRIEGKKSIVCNNNNKKNSNTYNNNNKVTDDKRILTISVNKIAQLCNEYCIGFTINAGVIIYLTGIIEFLCEDFMEIIGGFALNNGKKKIIPKHIEYAITSDSEYRKLLNSVMIYKSK